MALRNARPCTYCVIVLLAGCVPAGDFPSLAPRPAERALSFEDPARPPQAVASDPVLQGRIAELSRMAAEGERGFDAELGSTTAAVAADGAEGSDAWVTAQQAISRLEAARAPTTRAIAELDRLRIDRTGMPTNESDFASIEAAIVSAERLAEDQQARLDRLRSQLGDR